MSRLPAEIVAGTVGPESLVSWSPVPGPKSGIDPLLDYALDLPPGTVEYHSAALSLRLQLTNGRKLRDPDSGYEHVEPGVSIQFRQGRVRTADPEVIHRIEGCPAGCKVHKTPIPAFKGYGLGRTVWRSDVAREAAKVKSRQQMVAALKANPEQLQVLLQELESEGFVLGPNAPSKAATAPTAPATPVATAPVAKQSKHPKQAQVQPEPEDPLEGIPEDLMK